MLFFLSDENFTNPSVLHNLTHLYRNIYWFKSLITNFLNTPLLLWKESLQILIQSILHYIIIILSNMLQLNEALVSTAGFFVSTPQRPAHCVMSSRVPRVRRGMGRTRIRTRDCWNKVWWATVEPLIHTWATTYHNGHHIPTSRHLYVLFEMVTIHGSLLTVYP